MKVKKKKTCLFNKKLPVIYGGQKKINNNAENGRVRIRRNNNNHLIYVFIAPKVIFSVQPFSYKHKGSVLYKVFLSGTVNRHE